MGHTQHPFNDQRHIPTRPEIDLLLGMTSALELRRLEERIDMLTANVDWQMHWYSNESAWGYRASYQSRVLCVVHFSRGAFVVIVSIPAEREKAYRGLKDMTPSTLANFANFRPGMKAKQVSFRVRDKEDCDGVTAVLAEKIRDIRAALAKR
jgi:hypothetical protein